MNEIKVFNSSLGELRQGLDISGSLLFVAKDVCDILEISKYRDALTKLDEDESGSFRVDTPGGLQDVAAVNESDLYTLIMRSDKKLAKAFQKWVTSEVLPSIRKAGGYFISKSDNALEMIMARALIVTQETIARSLNELKLTKDQLAIQKKVITESVPKVKYFERGLNSIDSLNTTQFAKNLGMSAKRLNIILREKGIQYKINGQWVLIAKYQAIGYTKSKTKYFLHQDGRPGTQLQTVWTESGRKFVYNIVQPQTKNA